MVAGDTVLTAALTDVAGDIAVGGAGRPSVTATSGGRRGWSCPAPPLPSPPPTWPTGCSSRRPSTAGWWWPWSIRRPTGVRVERAVTTNREVHPHLHLDGVTVAPDDLLAGGDPTRGARGADWMLNRAWTGLCALQVGVTEAAVAQTAAYLNTREQFGRPLSTFQGTMLRAADAAIDTESIRVTMWQAAWRLDNGLDAELAVSVASWFAAEAGQRAVFATQHLHGGMGADISYPIHRYFLWGKQIELLLGPPERPTGPAWASSWSASCGPAGRCRHERDDRSRRGRLRRPPCASRRCRWATPCPSWPCP